MKWFRTNNWVGGVGKDLLIILNQLSKYGVIPSNIIIDSSQGDYIEVYYFHTEDIKIEWP